VDNLLGSAPIADSVFQLQHLQQWLCCRRSRARWLSEFTSSACWYIYRHQQAELTSEGRRPAQATAPLRVQASGFFTMCARIRAHPAQDSTCASCRQLHFLDLAGSERVPAHRLGERTWFTRSRFGLRCQMAVGMAAAALARAPNNTHVHIHVQTSGGLGRAKINRGAACERLAWTSNLRRGKHSALYAGEKTKTAFCQEN